MRSIWLLVPTVMLIRFFVSITAVSAQSDDPVTVLQRYYAARNRGDVSEAMTAIAPDATYQSGVCVPVCVGAAEIQKREVEGGIGGGNQYTVLDATLSGMTVTLRVQIRNNLARRAGVDRFIVDVTTDVQDGKIVAYRAVLDASDPETAAYQSFQSSQPAGQPTPAQVPTELPDTGELAPRLPLVS